MKTIVVTGGAGFVGSNISIHLKEVFPSDRVIAFDSLRRAGSELNVPRLKKAGVEFAHGDIRHAEDLDSLSHFDFLIHLCAEPSVLAGYSKSSRFLTETNLLGTLNVLEAVKVRRAQLVYLSTSRVYPIEKLKAISLYEGESRFQITDNQALVGVSELGVSEKFPLDGYRSLYGSSKLASEIMVQEFASAFQIPSIILRSGLIAGPWQMGKVEQGVVALWVARHMWGGNLSYLGFGGNGKQVRDVLDVRDLQSFFSSSLRDLSPFRGDVFNIGGGIERSVSLVELTTLCEEITGKRIPISKSGDSNEVDVPFYVSDFSELSLQTSWKPHYSLRDTVFSIYEWLSKDKGPLRSQLG